MLNMLAAIAKRNFFIGFFQIWSISTPFCEHIKCFVDHIAMICRMVMTHFPPFAQTIAIFYHKISSQKLHNLSSYIESNITSMHIQMHFSVNKKVLCLITGTAKLMYWLYKHIMRHIKIA